MKFFEAFQQRQHLWCTLCDWAIIVLVILSIVWRGGKSLDMTWILIGVVSIATITYHLRFSTREKSGIPAYLWYAVITFIAITVLSFVYSTTRNYGFDEVLRTGALSLLLFWIIRKVGDAKLQSEYLHCLLRVFGLTTVGACLLGIPVYLFQPVNRFVGTFFDYRFHTDYWPNAWAEFLLLAWPIVLFLALKDFRFDETKAASRVQLLIRSLVFGFVIGCLFLSYSRGGILVFIFQLLLWAGIVYKKTEKNFPVRRIVPISVVITVIALLTFITVNAFRSQIYDIQDVGEKVTFSASEGMSSVSERAQFWSQALVLSFQKPLLGWGPYSFRFIQPEFQNSVLATSDHPHNVLLKLLVERGLPALLVFTILVGFIFSKTVVHLRSREHFSLQILLFVGLVGVLLHNMIDFNLQFVGIALPFWLFLGVLMSLVDVQSQAQVSAKISRTTELLLALLLLIAATYEGGYLVISSLGRHAEATHNRVGAMKWYDRASGEVFARDLQLSRAKLLFEESSFQEAQDAIDMYMQRNSEDFRAWKRRGDIFLFTGQKRQALEAYEVAYRKGKYNDLGILRGILETYEAEDDQGDILARKEEIDALIAAFADAIQANTHFIALSPNVEELISICNAMSRLFPEDAPRYQVMAAKADYNAQIERGRIAARAPGLLW